MLTGDFRHDGTLDLRSDAWGPTFDVYTAGNATLAGTVYARGVDQ